MLKGCFLLLTDSSHFLPLFPLVEATTEIGAVGAVGMGVLQCFAELAVVPALVVNTMRTKHSDGAEDRIFVEFTAFSRFF